MGAERTAFAVAWSARSARLGGCGVDGPHACALCSMARRRDDRSASSGHDARGPTRWRGLPGNGADRHGKPEWSTRRGGNGPVRMERIRTASRAGEPTGPFTGRCRCPGARQCRSRRYRSCRVSSHRPRRAHDPLFSRSPVDSGAEFVFASRTQALTPKKALVTRRRGPAARWVRPAVRARTALGRSWPPRRVAWWASRGCRGS